MWKSGKGFEKLFLQELPSGLARACIISGKRTAKDHCKALFAKTVLHTVSFLGLSRNRLRREITKSEDRVSGVEFFLSARFIVKYEIMSSQSKSRDSQSSSNPPPPPHPQSHKHETHPKIMKLTSMELTIYFLTFNVHGCYVTGLWVV